jgi:hypothetical protein
MRQKCWRALCAARPSVLPWLLESAPGWDEVHMTAAIKLIRLALPPASTSTTTASASASNAATSSPGGSGEVALEGSAGLDVSWLLEGVEDGCGRALQAFVARFVVRPGAAGLRVEAANVLRGVWRLSPPATHGAILRALLGWVPRLRPYGDLGSQYFELLGWMVRGGGKGIEETDEAWLDEVVSKDEGLVPQLLAALLSANVDLQVSSHKSPNRIALPLDITAAACSCARTSVCVWRILQRILHRAAYDG